MSEPTSDDLDVQSTAGIVAVWIAPGSDTQQPCLIAGTISGQKRYMRVWPRKPHHVEWGWVRPASAVLLWKLPAADGGLSDEEWASERWAALLDPAEPEHAYVPSNRPDGACDECGQSLTSFVHVVGYREHGTTFASPDADPNEANE